MKFLYMSIFRQSGKFKFHSNLTRIMGTLRGEVCTFMISRSFLPRMRNFSRLTL